MTLDYISNINGFGDDLVRLYAFKKIEAIKFRDELQDLLSRNKRFLQLGTLEFIQSRNCNLVLRISSEDAGIISENKVDFYCDLTPAGYEKMILLLEPFCTKETKGYQWLYEDIDTPTGFLFSPAGTW